MNENKKRFYTAVSILIGTCIGAGVLGIPYVAAQAGFFVALGYIVLIGLTILVVNLYLGEISLRTKGDHQLAGYARKYLGKKGYYLMEFATFFGIYAAIIAYLLGISKSISFLAFGDASYYIFIGIGFGLFMSFLLWRGMKALKRFEKWGVSIVLLLLVLMFIIFFKDINVANFYSYNVANLFLPFGVVLFALMSFHAIPEVEIVLHKDEKLMKKVIVTAMTICMAFYVLFAFIVVGFKGLETPQIATLTLGTIFVLLGILTMFTSYLSLGNALRQNLVFDNRIRKKKAWFVAAIIPIILFVLTQLFDYFSFTKILSLGGALSGGTIGILVLMMVKNAKKKGNRKPEYEMPVNWFVIGILSLIFIAGILVEVF
jgi:amino acid permease